VELTQRVVRQNDIRLKIPDGGGERFFGVDTFGEGDEAGPIQLMSYELGIRFGILDHQNAYRLSTSPNGYISKWLTGTGRIVIALRHYLRFIVEGLTLPSQP
jgi:hypothetical protein